MGDREKCIQAQMDEYLSKPLQQNHLIQTILKCATLGGQLLEKNRERDLAQQSRVKATGNEQPQSHLRPPLENRAFSSIEPMTGPSLASPSLVTADQEDPITRARNGLSDSRSLTS